MTKVEDILSYLFFIAPENLKEDWDTVGLFCGKRQQEVKKVLIALDPSMDAILEAKKIGADLLLTHHPLLFRGTKNVSDQTFEGQKIIELVENRIAVIGMHTNLDVAFGGVNNCLANALGLHGLSVLHPTVGEFGIGRVGSVQPQSLIEFLAVVKKNLRLSGLRYVNGGKMVSRVAVGGGACSEFMDDAVRLGCDTFVTADVKYHEFQHAQELGLNLIDAGHFGTENPVCIYLARMLGDKFPDVAIYLSQNHRDIVEFA